MTIKTGFTATKLVNGETQPDFAAEQTNNNTTIGKLINSMIERLKRHKVPGTGGVVGTYDAQVLGEAAFALFHGATTVNVYGIGMDAQYFQTAKIL